MKAAIVTQRPVTLLFVGASGEEARSLTRVYEGLGYKEVIIAKDGRKASGILQDLSLSVPEEIKFGLLRTSEREREFLGALVNARRYIKELEQNPEQLTDPAIIAALETIEGKKAIIEVMVKKEMGII